MMASVFVCPKCGHPVDRHNLGGRCFVCSPAEACNREVDPVG